MSTPLILSNETPASLVEQAEFLSDALASCKLIICPRLNASEDERNDLMVAMSIWSGWKVEFDEPGRTQFRYREDHAFSISQAEMMGRNDNHSVITAWHLEHPHFKYPQVAGIWHMETKTCKKESGSTGFIDCTTLLAVMPEDYRRFLMKCQVVRMSFFSLEENKGVDIFSSIRYDGDRPYLMADVPNKPGPIPTYVRRAIVEHPLTGELLVRISPQGHYTDGGFIGHDRLAVFDGREPSKQEDAKFNEIAEWIFDNINNNEEIQYWHYWDQGDLLIVDIFAMAHSVRGGFQEGERVMKGIWAFGQAHDFPREPELPFGLVFSQP